MFENYIISAVVLLVVDIAWLGIFMGRKFGWMVSKIQGSPMILNRKSAIVVYLLLIIGVVMFGVRNVDPRRPVYTSLLYGGLWGLVTYGVFDFTNMAIFDGYDLSIALMDTLWGGFLGFIVTFISYKIISKLK